MIRDTLYFQSELEEIRDLIFKHDKDVLPLGKHKIYDFSNENIIKIFKSILMILPHDIQRASNDIGMSNHHIAIHDCYHHIIVHENLSFEHRNETQKTLEKNEYDNWHTRDSLSDIIDEFFHYLVYDYEEVISNTKKLHFFFNVSEINILKNLLNLYKNVLKDDSKQLYIFGVLPKNIADKITRMLIDFIEQRLAVLNPEFNYGDIQIKTHVKDDISKITWLGTQQEMIELLNELIDKKWIADIENRGMKRFVDTILNTFDLTNTQRNPDSDLSKSFYQQFKGEFIDCKRQYTFLDSENYERKFEKVKNNKETS